MFTIIGGDGKEYGPATAEQIRGWIAAGRANLDTKAKALGSDDWRRLADYPEFNGSAGVPPALPPTVAAADANLADRGTRLGAWALDMVAGVLAALPGGILLGGAFIGAAIRAMQRGEFDFTGVATPRAAIGANLLLAGGLILAIIQVWWLTARGQTIGKRALGIRIVRAADGQNPGFVSAVLLRSVVPAIIGCLPFVGFIFAITDILFIFRADRRCIHDLIANTKVVKA